MTDLEMEHPQPESTPLSTTCICVHLAYLCTCTYAHRDAQTSEVIQMYIYVLIYADIFVFIYNHALEREAGKKHTHQCSI